MVRVFHFFSLISLHVYTKIAGSNMLCGLSNRDKRNNNKIINEHTASFHLLLFWLVCLITDTK